MTYRQAMAPSGLSVVKIPLLRKISNLQDQQKYQHFLSQWFIVLLVFRLIAVVRKCS